MTNTDKDLLAKKGITGYHKKTWEWCKENKDLALLYLENSSKKYSLRNRTLFRIYLENELSFTKVGMVFGIDRSNAAAIFNRGLSIIGRILGAKEYQEIMDLRKKIYGK